jgi:hypothetical protein
MSRAEKTTSEMSELIRAHLRVPVLGGQSERSIVSLKRRLNLWRAPFPGFSDLAGARHLSVSRSPRLRS